MGNFDFVVTIIFSLLSLGALAGAGFSFRKALRVASERNGDIKMFGWTMMALVGLIVAGMTAAYILLPMFYAYSR